MIRLRKIFCSLGRDRSASPLAELALVIPFFVVLIFGCYEAGRLFYYQNILTKSVHDAARFAARHPDVIDPSSCVPGGGWASVQTNAETILKNGSLASANAIMPGMGAATVSITVSCVATQQKMVTSNVTDGTNTDIPIVIATASVPVPNIGFFAFIGGGTWTLQAEHREMAIGL